MCMRSGARRASEFFVRLRRDAAASMKWYGSVLPLCISVCCLPPSDEALVLLDRIQCNSCIYNFPEIGCLIPLWLWGHILAKSRVICKYKPAASSSNSSAVSACAAADVLDVIGALGCSKAAQVVACLSAALQRIQCPASPTCERANCALTLPMMQWSPILRGKDAK